MQHSRLLILTAIMIEAKAIASALQMPAPAPHRPSHRTIEGLDIQLHVIGIRGKGLAEMPAPDRSTMVIMAGLGGALDPALAIGDVVIDGLPSEFQLPLLARRGPMHCATGIAASPQQKASLFGGTGAIVVEMENDAVRHWLAPESGTGARLVAIRAISDRADQSLDPAVLRLVDDCGNPRIGPILWTLLRHPTIVASLARLGADSRLAARRLGEVVRQVVIHFSSTAPSKLGG